MSQIVPLDQQEIDCALKLQEKFPVSSVPPEDYFLSYDFTAFNAKYGGDAKEDATNEKKEGEDAEAPKPEAEQKQAASKESPQTNGTVQLKGAENLPPVYLRFARARKNHFKKAAEQLESAIKWRAEAKPYAIKRSEVERMMEYHTTAIGGFCNDGRPVVIVRLGAKSPCSTVERVNHLVFLMEEMQRRGYETVTWIIDFTLFGGRNKTDKVKTSSTDGDERPAETRKQTSHITQTYYPERLGKMLMYNYPWYIGFLMTLSRPFIDAGTRKKMVLVGHNLKDMDPYVKKSQLPQCVGGDLPDNGYENFEALGTYDADRIAKLLDKIKLEPCPDPKAEAEKKEQEEKAAEKVDETNKKDTK